MSEIRFGPLTEILRRRLQTDSAPSLSDTISPAIVLENDRPEYSYLMGEVLAQQYAGVSAVAAQYGYVQLFNPTNSGVLTVIDLIQCYQDTNLALLARYDTALGTLVSTRAPMRDTRWDRALGAFKQTQTQLRVLNSATAFGTFLTFGPIVDAVNGTEFHGHLEGPYLLGPGSGMHIRTGNVNQFLTVSFQYRERPMAPWERETT